MSLNRTMDELGRVVIPKELRENLGLIAGASMRIQLVNGCVVMTPNYGNRWYLERIGELLNVMDADDEKERFVTARQYLMRALEELEEYNYHEDER